MQSFDLAPKVTLKSNFSGDSSFYVKKKKS